LTSDFGAPPPSTIRRIMRAWDAAGVELGGHCVRAEKIDGLLYVVIAPAGEAMAAPAPAERPSPVTSLPYYHFFGRLAASDSAPRRLRPATV
jgi:hypothetical protein